MSHAVHQGGVSTPSQARSDPPSGCRIVRLMILRVTRARVRPDHEHYVLDVLREMTASMGAIPGLRSAEFGRALEDDVMWFVAITRWDSLDAIRAVYGESWLTASILPGSENYILETKVEHFETALDDITDLVEARGRGAAG
jgi:heme-degrading monooxygenase HmoA